MTNTSISLLEKYLGFFLCALLSAVRKILKPLQFNRGGPQSPKKIVFVKFIEQGAFVLHRAAFAEAASKYGAENIFICTFSSNAPLIELLGLIKPGNGIYINEDNIFNFSLGFARAIWQIRKRRIDTAIDLEFYSCATAIFCYLSGAKNRAGYHRYKGQQNYRGDLFTHRLNYSHYVHVADSGWSLLKCLELPLNMLPALDIPKNNYRPGEPFIPTSDNLARLHYLTGNSASDPGRLIIINPSLNDVLPLRRWPGESYAEFIRRFNARYPGYTFVFTGRQDEFDLTGRFIESLGVPRAINLCGKTTLTDILTLYTSAKLLLTSDSGPGHFASLTGVNSIVLFGPETPALYGPLSEKARVIYKAIPCSPCYNVYNNRQSPCADNVCMKKITVDEVLAATEEIMRT